MPVEAACSVGNPSRSFVSGQPREPCWPAQLYLQTVFAAELTATTQFAQHSAPGASSGYDFEMIGIGVRRGRVWFTAPSRPVADLWRVFWSKGGLQYGVRVKGRGHATLMDVTFVSARGQNVLGTERLTPRPRRPSWTILGPRWRKSLGTHGQGVAMSEKWVCDRVAVAKLRNEARDTQAAKPLAWR